MSTGMHAGADRLLFQRARDQRNNSIPAEEILWSYLRTNPFGLKFRRQHPYSIYIVDFYCHSLKLAIEVDGGIHEIEEVKKNDIERKEFLEKEGLIVIRFKNDELILSSEKVIESLNILFQKMIDDKKR